MLRIRLSRTGKKKQPSYRVVVADVEAKRDGRVVERIGFYNPLTEPADYRIDEGRALHWLSVGAQPSDAVKRLLEKQGTYDRLARFHSGEPIDALISEYMGEPLEAEKEAAGEAETVVEKVVDAAESVVEAVEDTVDDVVDSAEDVVAAVAAAVEEEE